MFDTECNYLHYQYLVLVRCNVGHRICLCYAFNSPLRQEFTQHLKVFIEITKGFHGENMYDHRIPF